MKLKCYNWNISSCCCSSLCKEVFTFFPCVITTAVGKLCISLEDMGLTESEEGVEVFDVVGNEFRNLADPRRRCT